MNLRVMRPDDGQMMKLVQYGMAGTEVAGAAVEGTNIIHNHNLTSTKKIEG